MKILLVSEGKNELSPDAESSPLVELTRRLLKRDAEFTRMKVSSPKSQRHMRPGKSLSYEKRALGFVRYAENNGFDALILVIDLDGDSGRIDGIQAAQDHHIYSLPRAIGVAIQTFDAWMLADEVALTDAFGSEIGRQQAPESLKKQAAKQTCKGLRDASTNGVGLTELYLQLAMSMSLDVLAERCPKGFAPFRSRVQALTHQ